MKLIVQKEINYVEEANRLLFNLSNQMSYTKMKEQALAKSSHNRDMIEKRYVLIIKISEFVYEHLRIEKSELEYYFKEIGTSSLSLSDYILPLYSEQSGNLEEFVNIAINKSTEAVIHDYNDKILQYDRIGKSGEEEKVDTFEELIRTLDKADIPVDGRWKILQSYINRGKHIEELKHILNKTIELIKECQDEVNMLEDEFFHYWSDYIAANDLIKEINKLINLNWEGNQNGTVIMPNLFYPQAISLSVSNEDEYAPNRIRFGILLDSLSITEPNIVDNDKLNSSLKLLSDKSKFEILMYIKDKPAYGYELANALNLSTSTISYHMSALISDSLVKLEKDANKIYYCLNKDRVNDILEHIRLLLLK